MHYVLGVDNKQARNKLTELIEGLSLNSIVNYSLEI